MTVKEFIQQIQNDNTPVTWDKAIKRALFLYVHRNEITYNLGCMGEDVESEKARAQYEYYYAHGWADKMGMPYNTWKLLHAGKVCMDCSGLLDLIYGYKNHNKSSWSYAGMHRNPSLIEGVAGSAVWHTGHVGLDIGYGYCVEIGVYNDTLMLTKLSERTFTDSFLADGIDYTGADMR